MDKEPARTEERLSVGGIKLSPELVLFNYSRHVHQACALLPTLRTLSHQQINIFFLSLARHGPEDTVTTSFCVLPEFRTSTMAALTAMNTTDNNITSCSNVGVLSIYPHRHNLSLLGKVLSTLAGQGVPIHGLCTSISALSILTDFKEFDAAVTALAGVLDLPPNHSPFRQEFRIRQICS